MEKAFTHSGFFHADDVFSSALLKILFPGIVIERGNQVPPNYDGVVFDIGRGKFDHHQENKRYRKNGVPYGAFGLLWETFGKEILEEEDALEFDVDFIQPIDLADNTGENNLLSSVIVDMNPAWNEECGGEEAFERAVDMARIILQRKFVSIKAKREAFILVAELAKQSQGNVLELEWAMPWKKAVCGSQVEYVIFPSNRGGYMVQAVPIEENSHVLRHPFPKQWRGKTWEQLQELTGIRTLRFCHGSGFLCVADTLEDARKTAQAALKNMDKL